MNHSTPEAPSTSPLALHHETENLTNWHDERIPFELREIGEAVHDILTPRTYTVLDSDSLHDVELALGATIGPNFIF